MNRGGMKKTGKPVTRIILISSSSHLEKECEKILSKQDILPTYRIKTACAGNAKNVFAFMQNYFQNMSADLIFILLSKDLENTKEFALLCKKIDGLYGEGASLLTVMSIGNDTDGIFEKEALSVYEKNFKSFLSGICESENRWIDDTQKTLEKKSEEENGNDDG